MFPSLPSLPQKGGANYDLGNAAAGVSAGNAGGLKKASAAFFAQKDAETEARSFVLFLQKIREGERKRTRMGGHQ